MLFCHSGNYNRYIWIGTDVAKCQCSVFNGSTRQRFHINKPYISFFAFCNQFFALTFHNVIRKHNCFHPIQIQCPLEHLYGVSGQSQMSDLSSLLCLLQGLQCTVLCQNLIQLLHAWIMYLININIICFQIAQAFFNISCHSLSCPGHTLGCNHKFIPDPLQCIAQIFLADSIAPGCVNVIYSPV